MEHETQDPYENIKDAMAEAEETDFDLDTVIIPEEEREYPIDEDDEPEDVIPDVELAAQMIEKIRNLFDAGSTRSAIAKELNIDRADVIEVLSKYELRNKINGQKTQVVDFKFDGTGRRRLELGDRLNTSIYISVNATEKEIEATKKKWLKIINNKND